MKKDKHHWIPVSLFGIDASVNLVTIRRDKHKAIHQLMNYNYRTYTTMWRAFRRRHNHKSQWDERMIEDILRMQCGYLDRYVLLDEYGQRLHMQKMNELTRFYQPGHDTQFKWSKLWNEYKDAFTFHHLIRNKS